MKLSMVLATISLCWFFVGCHKEDRVTMARTKIDWARTHLERIVQLDENDAVDLAWADEVAKKKIEDNEVWYCNV